MSFQQNKESLKWHWKQDHCQQNLGWMAAGEILGIRKVKITSILSID